MRIVLAGMGLMGFQVARTLAEEGHELVAIEADPQRTREISNRLDCLVITGRANNPEDLREAGLERADFFIALTSSDEVNIIACMLAAAQAPDIKTIARVRTLDYGKGRIFQNLGTGLSYVINPETESAISIVQSLSYGATSDIVAFRDMDVQIRSFTVPEDSPLVGQSIMEISRKSASPFLVILVNRDDNHFVPKAATRLKEGDHLFLTAREMDFEAVFKSLGKVHKPLRSLLFVGAGRITMAVLSYLKHRKGKFSRVNQSITVVESDYDSCKQIAEAFPEVRVVNADVSDENIFEEEQLELHDAVIACSNLEARNIVSSLYAKRRGVGKAIALVQSGNYTSIARQLDVDVAISLKSAVASSILRIIREQHVADIQTLGEGVEALEFILPEGSVLAGKALKDVTLPPDCLIIALKRGESSVIPKGSTTFEDGDRIFAICPQDHLEALQTAIRETRLRDRGEA